MTNMIEALQEANRQGREHIAQLEETAKMFPNAAGLVVSRKITEALIRQTEAAIASGDIIAMLAAAKANGLDAEQQEAKP